MKLRIVLIAVCVVGAAKPVVEAPNSGLLRSALFVLSDACPPESDDAAATVETTIMRKNEAGAGWVDGSQVFGACSAMLPDAVLDAAQFVAFVAAEKPDWTKLPQDLGEWDPFEDSRRAKLQASFRAFYGAALTTKEEGEGWGRTRSYNPKAVDAVLAKLLVKPGVAIGGVPAQRFYDAMFKGWVAAYARALAKLRDRPGFVETQATAFGAAAKAGGDGFYYADFTSKAVESLYTPEQKAELASGGWVEPPVHPRMLAFFLRRQLDGTLPVLQRHLKNVLKDFDPALAKELGARL